MNVTKKISDLSVYELKTLIREIMLETLEEYRLHEINDKEQLELETMFGKTPHQEKTVFEREIQV
ncbi:MAG: hypothetical protein ACTSX0_02870 [Promethearchaeota archaeon]